MKNRECQQVCCNIVIGHSIMWILTKGVTIYMYATSNFAVKLYHTMFPTGVFLESVG